MSRGAIHSFASLHNELDRLPRKQRALLVGIDGCGGSGKSTFARSLQQSCAAASVVHMDDFYLESLARPCGTERIPQVGANYDWHRLWRQVLLPLSNDEPARYQRYDWPTDALAEWICVQPRGLVVIEGIYSTRAELRHFYDYRVFVDCPRELRITRGVARDGEEARDRWEDVWCPAEVAYIDEHAPQHHANLVIDGAGRDGIDLDREFIAVTLSNS